MDTYCDVSRIMTFLASALVSAGLYAQCFKIFRTKSSRDFNPLLVAAMSVGQIVSLNYGLAIREWPIIAVSSLNLAPVTLIAIGCYRYRERGEKENRPPCRVWMRTLTPTWKINRYLLTASTPQYQGGRN